MCMKSDTYGQNISECAWKVILMNRTYLNVHGKWYLWTKHIWMCMKSDTYEQNISECTWKVILMNRTYLNVHEKWYLWTEHIWMCMESDTYGQNISECAWKVILMNKTYLNVHEKWYLWTKPIWMFMKSDTECAWKVTLMNKTGIRRKCNGKSWWTNIVMLSCDIVSTERSKLDRTLPDISISHFLPYSTNVPYKLPRAEFLLGVLPLVHIFRCPVVCIHLCNISKPLLASYLILLSIHFLIIHFYNSVFFFFLLKWLLCNFS
jgi:hypothetical protein